MARPRKPWFRKSNKRWYVEIDGKQMNLGSDRTEAHLLFHELMAQPVQKVPATPHLSLLEIVDQFLEWVQRHRSPDTYEWYRYRLQRFCRMYSDKMAMSIRPFHVEDWVNKYELSQTSIRNYKRAVKSCFRWAVKQGYLESNPAVNNGQKT